MSGPGPALGARVVRAAARRWDVLAIVALATWVLWPIPFAVPRSQDHTVHLARAWIVGQNLASGHVADWSPLWFFGFPAGELYPVLGDLAVSTIRGLSLWSLPWDRCYTGAFWLAHVGAALALVRIARVCGWGPVPGVIAAALWLLDPGETREGGFRFTVFFGVWLLPLAVSWTWCALAELHAVLERPTTNGRALVGPTAWLTAAMLAHPITVPLLPALLAPCIAWRPTRQWIRAAVVALFVVALALAAASWFLLPMAMHRAWMANFGALHHDLGRMVADAATGAWATNMAPAVGWAVTAGLGWALVRGDRFARVAATATLLAWLLASREAFWIPRLDRVSAAFGAMQYQRFILCAKPGMFLCAGLVVTAIGRVAWDRRAQLRARVHVAVLAAGTVALGLGWAVAVVNAALQRDVGTMQLYRGGDPETAAQFERDWHAYLAWARARWDGRDRFFRFAYRTISRHGHGFADAPVFTGAPAYKIGSTPGETFVHRVEDDRPAVLARARVRYVVAATALDGRLRGVGREVERFGRLRVFELDDDPAPARIHGGGGTVHVIRDHSGVPGDPGVVIEVEGATPGARIEFAIAGHPRWELLHDGRPVEWYEVPVVGDAPPATQDARRRGELRAGSADRTEPTEPMLLAVDAADGRWELRYRTVLPIDVLGLVLAALAIGGAVALRRRGAAIGAWLDRVAARLHPAVAAAAVALLLVAPVTHWLAQRRAQADRASTWLDSDRAAEIVGMHACPVEIERVIRGAICIEPGTDDASVVLRGLEVDGEPISGFIAVEDGSRARGQADLEISARTDGGPWVTAWHETFRFGRRTHAVALSLPFAVGTPVDLRIRASFGQGDRARLAIDLEL